MWEDNSHIQPPATNQLVGLQLLVCFWKESPPAGVQGVAKGFEAGLSKQQISNVFANQEALRVVNISPLAAIVTFSGVRNGKIKADFYDDLHWTACKRICCCWTIASYESNTSSWWGEDVTQVYSTEEVCRRVGN